MNFRILTIYLQALSKEFENFSHVDIISFEHLSLVHQCYFSEDLKIPFDLDSLLDIRSQLLQRIINSIIEINSVAFDIVEN